MPPDEFWPRIVICALGLAQRLPLEGKQPLGEPAPTMDLFTNQQPAIVRKPDCSSVKNPVVKHAQAKLVGHDVWTASLIPLYVGCLNAEVGTG